MAPPCLDLSTKNLGGHLLDHAILVLSTILLKPPARDKFLANTKPKFLKEGGKEENIWVVMDSSGEEEEDYSQTWCNLDEQDIIDVSATLFYKNKLLEFYNVLLCIVFIRFFNHSPVILVFNSDD